MAPPAIGKNLALLLRPDLISHRLAKHLRTVVWTCSFALLLKTSTTLRVTTCRNRRARLRRG